MLFQSRSRLSAQRKYWQLLFHAQPCQHAWQLEMRSHRQGLLPPRGVRRSPENHLHWPLAGDGETSTTSRTSGSSRRGCNAVPPACCFMALQMLLLLLLLLYWRMEALCLHGG